MVSSRLLRNWGTLGSEPVCAGWLQGCAQQRAPLCTLLAPQVQRGPLQAPPPARHGLHRGAVQDAQQQAQARTLRALPRRRRSVT